MTAAIMTLWSRTQGWVIAVGAAVAAAIGVYLAGKQVGRSDAKAGGLQSTIDQVRKRDDALSENAALDDCAIRDRARKRMRDELNDR